MKSLLRTFSYGSVLIAVLAVLFRLALNNDHLLARLDGYLDSLQEYKEHLETHIYLHDNYAPAREEHWAVPAKVVEGAIPDGLSGLFVRNGPNPIHDHLGRKRYHWFDGHGQLHLLRIKENGDLLYSNNFVPTPRYKAEQTLDKEYFFRLGELKGVAGVLKAAVLEPIRLAKFGIDALTVGQANTHTIMTKQHRFYAVHEASLPFEIVLNKDGYISAAVGYETFNNTLNYPVSAHPKVDHETGNFLFHSYSVDPKMTKKDGNFKFGEYSAETGRVESYFGVKTKDGHTSFGHDMMFTKSWFVILDNSVHLDPSQVFKETGNVFDWKEDQNLRLGLAPRHGANTTSDDVLWFDFGEPHIMIHPLNSWEEEDDGTVVMWSSCGNYFDMNIDKGVNKFYMAEFRMNPKTGENSMQIIDDRYNVEFPRIRLDHIGRFGRFGAATIMEPKLGGDGLFKGFAIYDMSEKKTSRVVLYREGDVGGEAVVLAKPGTTESHEFYVASFVRNTIEDKSFFVLYDGENGEQVVRVEIPYRVPYGFHCEWLDEKQLRGHLELHENRNMN